MAKRQRDGKAPTAKKPRAAAGSAEQRRALGEERHRAGAYTEAQAIFEELSKATPDDAVALRMRGLCRLRLGIRRKHGQRIGSMTPHRLSRRRCDSRPT